MYNKKLNRNDLCWCGSNIKYKKCHLGRDKQKPKESWEVSREFNRGFSRCICSSPEKLHHECDKKIIKAHTVPKSSSLKAIAENGHVLGLKMTLESIFKFKGTPQLEKIGINNASVFNGFCKKHDDSFFASIEKSNFKNTLEQCFFLAYRSFSREYYTKTSALETSYLRHQADKGKSIYSQIDIQHNNFFTDLGTKFALNDLFYHKKFFDESILTKDYSNIRAVVFTLETAPPVMVSGGVNPDYNFRGELIQDLMNFEKYSELLSVTSFFDGSYGKIVFSWLKNSELVCENLIRTLFEKNNNDIPAFLVQFIIKNIENFYISPKWWDSMNEENKEILLSLIEDTVSLTSEPSAFGLNTKLLDIEFPSILSIDFINWDLKGHVRD
ncbi:cytoplasmic protein [Photobacterium leiognathi subsp. mandapamensis]|nr:cytoplasmic protein [Photobacterium leiognathi subsp. mandapamensis]